MTERRGLYDVCLTWQAWRSFGKLRMEELFAKMGFSLAQCKVRQPHIPRIHASVLNTSQKGRSLHTHLHAS